MKMKLLMAASAMFALTACDQLGVSQKAETPAAEAPAPAVLPTEAEGAALFDKLTAAVSAGDPVALVALYAPSAVMVSGGSNELIETEAANLADATAFMKDKPTVVVNQRKVQVLDADTIVTTGVITMDVKKGTRTAWFAARVTDVFQKQADGKWLIVNEHYSAMPKPVAARLAPLAGTATAEQADAPPLGSATPNPTGAPAPEKK